MNEPKQHHHTPRFYLSSWASPSKRVFSFDKLTGRVSNPGISKTAGAEEGYYALPSSPAGWEETWGVLDNEFAIVLDELLSTLECSGDEIVEVSARCDRNLRHFIAFQLMRGPKMRDYFQRELRNEMVSKVGKVSGSEGTLRIEGRVLGLPIDYVVTFEDAKDLVDDHVVRISHLLGISNSVEGLKNRLAETSFEVVRIPDGFELITSDHPVVNPKFDDLGGLFIPLAPNLALLTDPSRTFHVGDKRFRVRGVASESVEMMNRVTLNQSYRRVYARTQGVLDDLVEISFRKRPANLCFEGQIVLQPVKLGQRAIRVPFAELEAERKKSGESC